MSTRDEIIRLALALNPADRAYVVAALKRSLSASDATAAWIAEIDRRIAAHKRGGAMAADANEAIQRMRQNLKAR